MPNATSFSFVGRKPSHKQALAKAKALSAQGYDHIEIQWGENWLSLSLDHTWGWNGWGHLRDIDAQSIARDLNNQGVTA